MGWNTRNFRGCASARVVACRRDPQPSVKKWVASSSRKYSPKQQPGRAIPGRCAPLASQQNPGVRRADSSGSRRTAVSLRWLRLQLEALSQPVLPHADARCSQPAHSREDRAARPLRLFVLGDDAVCIRPTCTQAHGKHCESWSAVANCAFGSRACASLMTSWVVTSGLGLFFGCLGWSVSRGRRSQPAPS